MEKEDSRLAALADELKLEGEGQEKKKEDKVEDKTGEKKEEVKEDGEDDKDEDEEEWEDEPDTYETWYQVIDAIKRTTDEAFGASPKSSSTTPAEFRAYWLDAFERLRESVKTDQSIPEYLTEPPYGKFTISLFDQPDPGCCPCGLPDVEPNIFLENENGVTKNDLMDGFIDCLFGKAHPEVFRADGGGSWEVDMPLIYEVDWMSQGKDATGRRIAFFSRYSMRPQPEIFMYCCDPDEFLENRQARLKAAADKAKRRKDVKA
ncbi:hypothetical protein FALBO_13996 [Fusarium albosuccineum]|uniref:Uncharacterized protein n=1 Tax=Fusarium albosuccineum TaxID=1237068 RepID=A0A8H4L109_9HYPO|nr:hypothetical protein FALBO_13996 [Fusarium albosuccineum]